MTAGGCFGIACRGASQEAVTDELRARELIGGGASEWVVWEYPYHRADGSHHLGVFVKRDVVTEKRKKTGKDGVWNSPKGVKPPHPVYRLPEILAHPGRDVLVVEGEHTADKARAAWNVLATTSKGGSGKWRQTDWGWASGRKLSLLSDGDTTGRAHMRGLADFLAGIGADVRLMLTPGEAKDDAADWIRERGAKWAGEHVKNNIKSLTEVRLAEGAHPGPQDAMKLVDANGRPALVAVEGGARAPAPDGGNGDMDAKRAALWYASQWGGAAAHSLGLGWFVRESGESIWTEDPGGVRIRCRIRDGLTGAESPAKRGTRTRDVELELRDELNVPADRWDGAEGVLGLPNGRVWDVARCVPREARPDEFVSKRSGPCPSPASPRYGCNTSEKSSPRTRKPRT